MKARAKHLFTGTQWLCVWDETKQVTSVLSKSMVLGWDGCDP